MIFHFEQALFLFLIFMILPAAGFALMQIKKLSRLSSFLRGKTLFKIRMRILLWSLAWIFAVIALAGPSWGRELVAVQKSGNALCFVFDISYSMTAADVQKNSTQTRLEAAGKFAQNILSRLTGTAVSAVLAKGDGALALPLTEDYNAADSLIASLSPAMLSAPGSSLSQGIIRAVNSFPPQLARHSSILIFTDGDETDGKLIQAVRDAAGYGIQVILVGFGSETETEVLAGDGVTRVKTALRSEKLMEAAQNENSIYIPAVKADALQLALNKIEPASFFAGNIRHSAAGTAYQIQSVKRHRIFLLLGLVLFAAGFFISRFRGLGSTKKFKLPAAFLIFMVFGLFSGCSDWMAEEGRVLQGFYYWSRGDYQKGAASFLDITERARSLKDDELLQYGLYGLSAVYLMQDESEAALVKLDELAPNLNSALAFAALYNRGIIAYRSGDYSHAAESFKKALRIDSTSLDAKINLELCLERQSVKASLGKQELIPAEAKTAPSGAGNAVFSLIRENEEKRWKNRQAPPQKGDTVDF